MARDRRSMRDKLKDSAVQKLDDDITEIENRIKSRQDGAAFDEGMVIVLKNQRDFIIEICRSQDAEVQKSKASVGESEETQG